MLAALAYWLSSAGVPATFHVCAAYPNPQAHVTQLMQGPGAGLVDCMKSLTGVQLQQEQFAGLAIRRLQQAEPAVKDSLMYN